MKITCNPTTWGELFMFYDISFQSSGYGLCVSSQHKITWRRPCMTVFISKNEKILNTENNGNPNNRKAEGDHCLLSHELFLEISFHVA